MQPRLSLAALMIGLLIARPAAAEMCGPGYAPCGDASSTAESVACVMTKTAEWDKRLNAAYKALQQRIDPRQADPLKAAQRLWLQYRTANCLFMVPKTEQSRKSRQRSACAP